LGSDAFVSRLLNECWRPRSRLTLNELISQACDQFDVTEQALQSRGRHRKLTRARAWIAHQATTQRIASVAEVARTFDRNEASLRESVLYHFHRSKKS
jgi:chromosomal replication initiation ATPase DnaA